MADQTFASLYAFALKPVFTEKARAVLEQGGEAFASAQAYAELGKPDFALAFLLLAEQSSEEEKRATLALAYERHATLAEEKAQALTQQFRQSFPLIKLEARRDRQMAGAIREGLPLPVRN